MSGTAPDTPATPDTPDAPRPQRTAALVFNPTAGQGRGARRLAATIAALERGFRLDVAPTASAAALRERARRAVEERLDALFVLGGDGTLRLAAQELAGSATALGALPGGTTNVVARCALGLPDDPAKAAERLVTGKIQQLDLGEAGGELFLMQLSGGIDARVLAAVDARAKRRWGKLAIAWSGLRLLARERFVPFELELDGRTTHATGFVLTNLPDYAGRFAIVPGARADDGALDLLLYRGRTRRAAVGFALALALGRHTRRRDVELVRGVGALTIRAPQRLTLQADGDPFEAAPPYSARLSARRLRVLAPTPLSGG